ncbi:MAG: sugar transferase [Chloroflexota bacterium]
MYRYKTRPVRLLTFITDLIIINVAFYLAYALRYEADWLRQLIRPVTTYHPYNDYFEQQVIYVILLIISFYQNQVWRRRRGEFWADEMLRVINGVGVATIIMIAYIFIQLPEPFSRLCWVFVPMVIIVLLAIARLLRRLLLIFLYQSGRAADDVLLIGEGETGRSVLRTLIARPELGYRVIGYMHSGVNEEFTALERRIPNFGPFENLASVLNQKQSIHSVLIALPGDMHVEIKRLINICRSVGTEVLVAPDLFQLSLSHVQSTNMGGIPMLKMKEIRISPLEIALKRLLDLTIIAVIAIPALILGLIIAIAIKLDSKGPVFYAGTRVGRDGQDFKMFKFRSMVVDADSMRDALIDLNEKDGPIFKIKDDPRLTRVGKVIRRLSLDELPQLINVLLGHMSMVGPRPPLREEVNEYQAWHKQRLLVKGGITGLWQVSGRSDLTFDEQALLDIYYIENWSLTLDLRIMVQTIPFTLFARGAY